MTDISPADFRALCAELVDELEGERARARERAGRREWGAFGDVGEIELAHALIDRARVALAQPEPQGPTDEELVELFNENDWNFISPETFIDIARSVLELQ